MININQAPKPDQITAELMTEIRDLRLRLNKLESEINKNNG